MERTGGDGPALFEDDLLFWTYFVERRDPLSTLQKRQGTSRDLLRPLNPGWARGPTTWSE